MSISLVLPHNGLPLGIGLGSNAKREGALRDRIQLDLLGR